MRYITKDYKKTLKYFLIVLLSAAVILTVGFFLLKVVHLINKDGFENLLSMYQKKAKLIYFLICFLQPIILPLPEPVTIIGGSSVLGTASGTIIGFMGTFLGILVMYFISKYAGRSVITKLVDDKKLEKFNKFIKKNEMLVILMLFILPILPDEVICVGAGLAAITTYKFIVIAAIAKLITSASLAYSLELIKFNAVTIISLILLVLAYLLIKRFRISTKRKVYHS